MSRWAGTAGGLIGGGWAKVHGDLRKLKGAVLFLPVFIALFFLATGCGGSREYSSQEFLMDTIVEITAYAGSEEEAREGTQAAFDKIKAIADLTDRFPEKGSAAYERSDVCRINTMAGIEPVQVSDAVLEMLVLSQKYYEITEGAFDVTVGPLMDLWGFGTKPAVPDAAAIREKLKLVGMDKMTIDPQKKTVYLARPGMAVDLGGIAKGYAAEAAAKVLRDRGISQAVINAGGNVVVLGGKKGKDRWKLGIQDPRNSGGLIGVLALKNKVAVTSGDYQRYFESGGKRYHHLLDPETGMPARGAISVTVVCDSSAVGDILSTALFVLGPEKGLELAESLQGVEAVFVSAGKEIDVTEGLRKEITLNPGEEYSYDPNR